MKHTAQELFSIILIALVVHRNTMRLTMRRNRKRSTGLRLCEDQLEKLDILVKLAHGRKDRSVLIREAVDVYIETRIPKIQTERI